MSTGAQTHNWVQQYMQEMGYIRIEAAPCAVGERCVGAKAAHRPVRQPEPTARRPAGRKAPEERVRAHTARSEPPGSGTASHSPGRDATGQPAPQALSAQAAGGFYTPLLIKGLAVLGAVLGFMYGLDQTGELVGGVLGALEGGGLVLLVWLSFKGVLIIAAVVLAVVGLALKGAVKLMGGLIIAAVGLAAVAGLLKLLADYWGIEPVSVLCERLAYAAAEILSRAF